MNRRPVIVLTAAALLLGVLGSFGLEVVDTPLAVADVPTVTAVAAGFEHSCALTSTGGVKCWGYNGLGQLGDGTTANRSTPVDVVGLTSGVTAITAGGNHTCALTAAGGVKCWGGNGFGGIGDGTNTDRWTPVDVAGLTSGVAAVAAGAFHTCAVTSGGAARCWGDNDLGELGDGTYTDRWTSVGVTGLFKGVRSITAGGRQTCVIMATGGTKCWGHNAWGQVGDGTGLDRQTPVDVVGLASGTASVSAGGRHTCALTSAGGAKCWGRNDFGQVGDGSGSDRLAPVDVFGLASGVRSVSGGRWHACAVTTAGAVKCWGSPDGFGEVGDPKNLAPIDIDGLSTGAVSLAAGEGHTCVVISGGGVKCFGNNFSGELGDGTTTSTMTAVDVRFDGPSLTSTNTALTSSPNPSTVGQAVTFTATVTSASGSGTPTGTVTFLEGGTTLGTASLNGSTASVSTTTLSYGSHSITAAYSGDASFSRSTSPPLTQSVTSTTSTGPPTLAVNDVAVKEGNTGTTSATFAVSLSAPSSKVVSVRVSTRDGSATSYSDYRPVSTGVSFNPGETRKTVVVPVVGDTRVEPNETFAVLLSSASNATIADGLGTGTILNDD